MSFHIDAEKGQIAEIVLLPGDPLRTKYIAETFLEDAVCYNTVRNMLGYTGTYKGKKISVQGTGMGMPSATLYIHELINDQVRKRNLAYQGFPNDCSHLQHCSQGVVCQGSADGTAEHNEHRGHVHKNKRGTSREQGRHYQPKGHDHTENCC